MATLIVGDRVRYAHDVAIHMAEFADMEGHVIERIDHATVVVEWNNGDRIPENMDDLIRLEARVNYNHGR